VSEDILLERVGAAGVVTLNRPKALNALTHGMVRLLAPQLRAWGADPAVRHVIIRGAGDRAFCAGGDIRLVTEGIKDGRFEEIDRFYRDEYRLNTLIKRFPKPYVALLDGIVMGGGVGVSFHGSHRVVTERLTFAMPEVGIGFFPDVGATYLLPRLPEPVGLYLALTGTRIGADDALWAGLATHKVPSSELGAIFEALTVAVDIEATLGMFRMPKGTSKLAELRPALQRLLAGGTLRELIEGLERAAGPDPLASEILATIRQRSPTSVALAFEQMRRGRTLGFEDAMRLEYRIVSQLVHGRDFVEGVRALIVDKDNRPSWEPPTIEALSPAALALHFEAPPVGDLDFPP
jgi:enoyl-CoA hydratase